MTEDGGGADPPAQAGLTGRPPRNIPDPKPKSVHGPAKVIAMCNQKGGVGKTTSTINLGASLAGYGRRVLLVDLDPQGALSAGLGVPHYELDQRTPLTPELFNRWVALWNMTVDQLFAGAVADEAKRRAEVTAAAFARRLSELRDSSRGAPLL